MIKWFIRVPEERNSESYIKISARTVEFSSSESPSPFFKNTSVPNVNQNEKPLFLR